ENAFFDEKCKKLNGRCVNSCQKNEELVALCQKSLKCCVSLQPCGKNKEND
ncbi:beta-defensin 106 precursor, partial [Daubentonia madagascariensis]